MFSGGDMAAVVLLGLASISLALVSVLATRRRLARVRREAAYVDLVANHAPDGLVVLDLGGTVLWVNDAYCSLMGRTRDEMIGRNPLEFAMPPDLRPTPEEVAAFRFGQADDGAFTLHRNQHGSGREFWCEIGCTLTREEGRPPRAVLVCRDASEQVRKADELRKSYEESERLARQDPLTGVANRGEFLRVAEAGLVPGLPALGLLHLDVDHFKEVNDSIGHPAGDAVLCHIANVLVAESRTSDLVARLGGDEFVLVSPGIGSLDALEKFGQRISERLSVPMTWQSRKVPCGVSIGGALSGGGDLNPEDLLGRSDVALYEAKRAGRGRLRLYDDDLHRQHITIRRLSDDLRQTVANQRLSHQFQPTVCLSTGAIRGFETLVRWSRPKGATVGPDDFLHIAREQGLMAEIDFAAMEAALAMHCRLRDTLGISLIVGFNASPEVLGHPDFLSRLDRRLHELDVPPSRITVEVLETVFFGDGDEKVHETHAETLKGLRDLGLTVLLDDFGMGYAGLTHLASLPVSGVKLDRSLAHEVDTDTTKAEIVRALCDLTRKLGMHIVVEGIETDAQVALLRTMGQVVGQGRFISDPLGGDEVLDFLSGRTVADGSRQPDSAPAAARIATLATARRA